MGFKNINKLLATWFYLGQMPRAPGTWGTLGAIPFVVGLYLLGPLYYMGLTLLFVFFSIYVCDVYEAVAEEHDSKEIVIDEVAGFFVAMTWLPLEWHSFCLAFVLFRLLDILKPFPIGLFDRKIKGGLGVVADDVAAGLITNLVLQSFY